jgi:hypothetical protein
MKCAIFGISIESIDEGAEGGRTPNFYEYDKGHEFACTGCKN